MFKIKKKARISMFNADNDNAGFIRLRMFFLQVFSSFSILVKWKLKERYIRVMNSVEKLHQPWPWLARKRKEKIGVWAICNQIFGREYFFLKNISFGIFRNIFLRNIRAVWGRSWISRVYKRGICNINS